MVVCKFYLQGHCRYGDRCWNDHHDGSHNNAALKGDYYVSPDSRSLWRKDTQQPSFSFKQALNTSNRFGAFQQNRHGGQKHFSENMYDDSDHMHSSIFQRGGSFASPGNPFGYAHHGSSNPKFYHMKSEQQQQQQHQQQFQTRAPVEFSFNAAHQASQSSNRAVVPPTTFSFTGALNRSQPKDTVAFSFVKAAQNQNQNSSTPGTSRTFMPQKNVNSFGKNVTAQPVTLFGKPTAVSGNTTVSNVTKTFSTEVPSILATSDVLKAVSVYTAMAQLKEWEREQFSANIFLLGKIPTKPPPQELC